MAAKWLNSFDTKLYYYTVSEGKMFFFKLALTESNKQVIFDLKVVLKSWDVEILIIRTIFQKSNPGCPQQPPTEKVQKLKNDISWFHWKKIVFKTSNKAKFKNMDDSGVLSSDFPDPIISAASMTSTASVASLT